MRFSCALSIIPAIYDSPSTLPSFACYDFLCGEPDLTMAPILYLVCALTAAATTRSELR